MLEELRGRRAVDFEVECLVFVERGGERATPKHLHRGEKVARVRDVIVRLLRGAAWRRWGLNDAPGRWAPRGRLR